MKGTTRDLQNRPRPCPLHLHLFWRQERRDPDVSLPHDILIEHRETVTAIPCRRRWHALRMRRPRRRPLCAMTNLVVNATDRCGRRGHPHILEWLRGRLRAGCWLLGAVDGGRKNSPAGPYSTSSQSSDLDLLDRGCSVGVRGTPEVLGETLLPRRRLILMRRPVCSHGRERCRFVRVSRMSAASNECNHAITLTNCSALSNRLAARSRSLMLPRRWPNNPNVAPLCVSCAPWRRSEARRVGRGC
eukprot:COSAG01_NODE_17704_length_1130_cov_1.232784_2_plen_245_part_00